MVTDCKTCWDCGKTKPIDEMKKHRRRPNGIDDVCLICHAKQDAAYRQTPNGKAYKFLRNKRSQYKKKGIPNPINEVKYLQWAIPFAQGVDSIKTSDLPEFVFLNSTVIVEPEKYLPADIYDEFIPSKVKNLIQGAHIHELRGASDNHTRNGLVLRMDLHRLYDWNLLAINPYTYEITIHDSVLRDDPDYIKFNGTFLKFNVEFPPHHESLLDRWSQYQQNIGKKYKNKVERDAEAKKILAKTTLAI